MERANMQEGARTQGFYNQQESQTDIAPARRFCRLIGRGNLDESV
jgi:hypothetical protein